MSEMKRSLTMFNKFDWNESVRFILCFSLFSILFSVLSFISVILFSAQLASKGLVLFSFSLLFLLIFWALCYLKRSSVTQKPEFYFVLLGVPAVALFSLFILPGGVPDELAHIWQCVALFDRNNVGFDVVQVLSQDSIPKNYHEIYLLFSSGTDWGSTFICTRNLGGYYWHLYLIPWFCISIAKLLNINVLFGLFAGRMLNGLFFVFCGYQMIRFIPFGKTFLSLFLLNPILIQQESSCSADAICNIVAISFVCFLTYLYFSKCWTRRLILVNLIYVPLLLASKVMFAPLLLAELFIIPRKTKQNALLIYSVVGVICFVAAGILVACYQGSFMPESFELMRDPFLCVKVLLKSFWEMSGFWTESLFGFNLGALTINVWKPCFLTYLIMLFVVCFYNDDNNSLVIDKIDKVLFIAISFINLILIILTMRGWTLTADHRSDIIMGVQGRYLFPVILLPFLCLVRPVGSISEGNVISTTSFITLCILFLNMVPIVQYYL